MLIKHHTNVVPVYAVLRLVSGRLSPLLLRREHHVRLNVPYKLCERNLKIFAVKLRSSLNKSGKIFLFLQRVLARWFS